MHWNNGKRYVFNSDGHPLRSEGPDLIGMRYARLAHLLDSPVLGWWIEATYRDDDGTLFAWYHHETFDGCPDQDGRIATPVIGAAVSKDNGHSFRDLGFVLVDGNPPNCEARNGYFAGGHGDFSVILDKEKKYFYFLFSTYSGQPQEQGVAVARMAYADRYEPAGKVRKYHNENWESEGIWGAVSPIYTVRTPWESEGADAFWGPSIHYNRELDEYVMLLNRTCCSPGWPAEGIYVAFNSDIANPAGWSEPERIIAGGGWYPMVVGLGDGDTDKSAGSRARLFIGSDSYWEILFRRGQTGVLPLAETGRRSERAAPANRGHKTRR